MTGQEKTVTIDTSCDWVVPIWLDRTEVDHMTDGTLRQILAHNETWKEKCNDGKMPDKKVDIIIQWNNNKSAEKFPFLARFAGLLFRLKTNFMSEVLPRQVA
jgi:hypothetical protein